MKYEEPHFVAMCEKSGWWRLPLPDLARFHTQWDALAPKFYDGPDIYGQPCRFPIADVIGSMVVTAESLALQAAEEKESREKELFGSP